MRWILRLPNSAPFPIPFLLPGRLLQTEYINTGRCDDVLIDLSLSLSLSPSADMSLSLYTHAHVVHMYCTVGGIYHMIYCVPVRITVSVLGTC